LVKLDPQCELLEPFPSPAVHHYRSKVEFSFQESAVGFHWRGRFDHVIEVDRCYLAPEPHSEVLRRTRRWARRFHLEGWNPRRQTGQLRYVVFRRATSGDWLAVLIGSPEVPAPTIREWAADLADLGPRALLWAAQTSTACAVKPDSEEVLAGEPFLRESLGSLRFHLNWQSFFQSNPRAYLGLLEAARTWCALPERARVLDLFCGIGTIGLFLTPPEGRLVGVESVPQAVDDARQAAALNRRSGEFHCSAAQDWPDLDCDLLILDPPRSGCHPKLIERLIGGGPPRILYVSCNPHLWLKEAELLRGSYRIVRAQPFDFFPHTRHVELLALLERR
jgi:23S rRNA (uracil1939-C5)-methyltransferase